MMCGQAKEWIAASWTGELDEAAEAKLRRHLLSCPECAGEMSQLGGVWERMADLPTPEPSQAMRVRWESTLESLMANRKSTSWRFTLASLWPERPVWQATIAASCLVLGLAAGMLLQKPGDRREIATLREEIASTREMVALSLLQQQSATERLRGVDYTQRMPSMEPQVVSALIDAVQHDENVNVRLAAIDALGKVSRDAKVRQSLTHSLAAEQSPMVQAALIDYAADAGDPHASETLQRLSQRPDVNPAVRQRASKALSELTRYR